MLLQSIQTHNVDIDTFLISYNVGGLVCIDLFDIWQQNRDSNHFTVHTLVNCRGGLVSFMDETMLSLVRMANDLERHHRSFEYEDPQRSYLSQDVWST
jgi:hypothetical protein